MLLEQLWPEIRVIGYLPGTIPFQAVIPLADALLASPVMAVVIRGRSAAGGQLAHDIKARGGAHILVGRWADPPLASEHEKAAGSVEQNDLFEGDFTISGGQLLSRTGYRLQVNALPLEAGLAMGPWLAGPLTTAAEGHTAFAAGAHAILPRLWLRDKQSMAETITRARLFNQLAEEATDGLD